MKIISIRVAYTAIYFSLMFLVSCSNFHGRIESTSLNDGMDGGCLCGGKVYYVVNTSTNERYKFIIKKVFETGESYTVERNLNPGEQSFIGCDSTNCSHSYSDDGWELRSYSIVGELKL